MKKIPLGRKVRRRSWLANFIAMTLLIESAAVPTYAGLPDFCERVLNALKLKNSDGAINLTDEQRKEDRQIKKENLNIRMRPLNYIEVDALVEHYTSAPRDLDAWLKDFRIRKARAATSRSEDLAAVILTTDEAADDWEFLRTKRNIWVKQRSSISLFTRIFSDQRDQASVDRQWITSKILDRRKNMKEGKGYARGYTIMFPRDITYAKPGESQPTLDFDKYMVSLAQGLHVIRDGTEEPKFFIRDAERQIDAFMAAGNEAFQISFADLFFENNFTIEPLRNVVRTYIKKAFSNPETIREFLEKINLYIQNPSLLEQDDPNLSPSAKKILAEYGPAAFFIYIVDTTGEKEIPKKLFNFFAKLGAMGAIIHFLVKNISGIFGGVGAKFNGNNDPNNNAACFYPLSTYDDDVMLDKTGFRGFSPFLDVFILPNQEQGHEGQPNPCDPNGDLAKRYKTLREQIPDDSDFLNWMAANGGELAILRSQIRDQYRYTRPNYSACSQYYSWYWQCGPGKSLN